MTFTLGLLLASGLAARGETLDFHTLQHQALAHSFALKIADSEIALRKIDCRAARALYLPTLSLRYDFGYAWALDGQQQAVTIGETVSATDLSTWRNSLSLSGSLLLYESGARQQQLAGARHALRAAKRTREGQLQQLKLQVLDRYLRGLQAQEEVDHLRRIVDLHKLRYRGLARLQAAGSIGRPGLQQAALELAVSLTRLDDARISRQEALAALAELTGQGYPEHLVRLSAFPEVAAQDVTEIVAVQALPQVKALNEEEARLRAERSAARRRLFPSIGLYGNYRLYGSASDSGGGALADLGARDATLAMVVQWQFSGFRDRLQLARLDERLRRLHWQRRQRIAELEREIGSLSRRADLAPERSEHLLSLRRASEEVARTTERLREQELLGEPETLARKIDLLERTLQDALVYNRQQADMLRLRIWQEGGQI